MKTKLIIFAIFNLLVYLPIGNSLISQNINGKLGTSGQFIIRDTTTTFLTVSQSTGDLSLYRSLILAEPTPGSQLGSIFKGTFSFIHDYSPIGSGVNTFVGINSGNFTLNVQSVNNTGVGVSTLYLLTSGSNNSAFGVGSIFSNTSGNENSAFGSLSLYNNSIGNQNSAFGFHSLFSNSGGVKNTAVGHNSLFNTTGDYNTALGSNSGSTITTGSYNIAIGYDAQVPNVSGSYQVRVGSTAITYAGVQVAWTITSDRRWKSDIKNSDLGLSFISKLNPVSYIRTNDEKQKTEYGFIAQEVEEALKESGTEKTGMINIDDAGKYELRYNDLLAPMVKAIQELNTKCAVLETENNKLKNNNEKLSAEIKSLKSMSEKLAKLEQMINEITTVKNVSLTESK